MDPDVETTARMRAIALEAAEAFQQGVEAHGQMLVVKLIDQILANLAALPDDRMGLEASLKAMFEAQSRGDLLYLADLLAYEIAPLLNG